MSAYTGPLVILESVDSTNNYAMAQLHTGTAQHLNAWFTMEQTEGRGRRGKKWETQKAQNIVLSIVLDTHFLRVYEQFQISVLASLSCADLLRAYTKDLIKIKWPNDLYWNDRKAGGILIENVISGIIWQWSVIGIGININQTNFLTEKNQPVSLKEITGKTYDVIELAKQLYYGLIKRLEQLKTDGFEKMLGEYNSLLYKRNETVKLKKQQTIFMTTVKGVSYTGHLQTLDSFEHDFDFDEVEWIL